MHYGHREHYINICHEIALGSYGSDIDAGGILYPSYFFPDIFADSRRL